MFVTNPASLFLTRYRLAMTYTQSRQGRLPSRYGEICALRTESPASSYPISQEVDIMQRREFLLVLSGIALAYSARAFAEKTFANNQVTIMQFSDDGKPLGPATLAKVNKTPSGKSACHRWHTK
jgi:hypothetical protein